ncbi:hypothetical protein, partial [Roseobacter sp. HKCCA0434]|uniref:hypothetical protein n=1 Tax=Roseobacter sp. HKCCA0434 TaxID=3079297 RepID=UPI002905DBE5
MGKHENIAKKRLGEATLAAMKAQMVPMEPRIMLDATLDLDPGAASGLDIFHAVVGSLDAQTQELQDTFSDYQDTLTQAIEVAGGLLDAGSDFDARGFDSAVGGATDLAGAQATAEAMLADIRDTVEAAKAAFEANLDTFVQANKDSIASNIGSFDTAGSNGVRGDLDDVSITFTGTDIESILTFDNLTDEAALETALDALIDAKVSAAVTGADVDALRVDLQTAVLAAPLGGLFELDLNDVVRDGETVVSFTNDGGTSKVNVVVDVAQLGLNLDVLLGSVDFGLDTTELTQALLDGTTTELSFDIAKEAVMSGTTQTGVKLVADNFVLPEIVAGGAGIYDGAGAGPSLSLGFVSGSLETIDMAEVKIATTGVDSIELSSTFTYSTGSLSNSFNVDPISVATTVKEIGGAGFTAIADDTSYRLIEVTIAGDVDTQAVSAVLDADAFDAANQTDRDFALVLGVEAILGSAQDDFVSAFADSVALDVASEFAGISNGTIRAAVEAAVDAFAAYGAAQMQDVLRATVSQIQNFLSQDIFDVELPFTDLSLGDALAPISDTIVGLVTSFEVDLSAAGLDTGVALQTAQDSITGGETDEAALTALGSFDLDVTVGTSTSTITVSGPFANLSGIAAAMDAALDAFGVSVSLDAADRFVLTPDVAGADISLEVVEDAGVEAAFFGLNAGASFAAVTSALSADIDVTELAGMEALVLDVTDEAGVKRKVRVDAGTGFASLADLAAKADAALEKFNLNVAASGGKLAYSLIDVDKAGAEVIASVDDAVRALSLDGLVNWANGELDEVLPDTKLSLSEDGKLVILLPEVGAMVGLAGSFNMDELGFGDIAGLDLNTNLAVLLSGELNTALAVDVAALIGDAVDALNERADNGGDLDRSTTFADHVYLQDTSVFGRVNAAATSLSATADLGLVKAEIGADTPTDNFVVVDAQLYATMTSEEGGSFSNSVSLQQIFDKIGDGYAGELVGQLELGGGAITTESGEVVLSGGNLKLNDNIYENAFDAGEIGNVAVVHFGDVSIEVAGLGGLTEDAVNAVTVAAPDLFDTDSWTVVVDSPVAEALIGLQTGDTLDTLTNIAGLLVQVGETLETQLPFLGEDIPILNFSLLDVANFSEDFLKGVQDARNNPQATLDKVDAQLEEVFGDDTVELAWDGATDVLTFDLNLVYGNTETVPFAIDLAALLGDELETILGADVAEFVTGLVDARGDAELSLTTDLILDLSFGIDLSGLLAEPTDLAETTTDLALLASVGSVIGATGNDLRITRIDRDTGARSLVDIDLDGAETVADVVALIDAAVGTGFGNATLGDGTGANTSFTFDAATGEFVIVDQDATARDRTGLDALFGTGTFDSADVAGTQTVVGTIAPGNAALEYSFDVTIGGESATVTVAADGARTTAEDLADAIEAAMRDASIARSAIDPNAVPGTTVAIGQLLDISVDGGMLKVEATDFAEAQGYDPITFSLEGMDVSHTVEFEIEELDGSNAARMLGFEDGQELDGADARSDAVYESAGDGKVRLFLDTDETSVRFELKAGAENSINAVLGLGPVEATVTGGTALIDAGDGSGDAARIGIALADADGDANDGQLDLSKLGDLANPLDLFIPDVKIGVNIDLPIDDNLGLLGDDAGFSYVAPLIQTKDGITAANFDIDDVLSNFEGDLVTFFEDPGAGYPTANIELNLDGLADGLSDINVLELLNDPRLVLNGLDLILAQTDKVISGFLDNITLPVIGDGLSAGLSVIDDLRYDLIAPALEYANQPKADGTLPTTVDLLTGFVNDAMNDLFGTSGVTYLQAFLDTSGATNESYLYGNFNFSGNLFSASLDAGFDIGIPGFDLEFEEGTALDLSLDYTANIGFGIDSKGFYLLNDEDEAEISIDFTVDAGTFAGSFTMFDLLRFSATAVDTANKAASGFTAAPGEGGYAGGRVGLTAALEADLFGDQGTAARDLSGITVMKGADVVEYDKEIRLSALKMSDLVGLGFSADAFAELQLKGEVLNPTTGDPITIGGVAAIPTVMTELVVEASFDTARSGPKFTLDTLTFEDVRLDGRELYNAFLKPIIDPIDPIIDPLADVARALNTAPISFALDALANVFPVVAIGQTIADIIIFVDDIVDSGGWINFGTFDFAGQKDGLANGSKNAGDLDSDDLVQTSSSATVNGRFGGKGLTIDLPIITDPSNVIALLLGNYEDVNLVTATYSLIDFEFDVSIVGDLIASAGLPSKVVSPLRGALDASVYGKGFAGFTVGYDMSGIVNFIDTLQAERLLDGVFIDSSDGGLVDFEIGFSAYASISIAIASAFLRGDGNAYFRLGFNDPNNDGKLRIPEVIRVGEAALDASDFVEAMELVFKGEAGFGFSASAGGKIGVGKLSASFSINIFNFSQGFTFGGLPIPGEISSDVSETNNTAILNVGSRSGLSFTNQVEDGNDTIIITGPNSPVGVSWQAGSVSQTASLDAATNAIIIPGGDGDNTIDMSGMTNNGGNPIPTLTYTGSGTDTITLSDHGFHVVFAGEGDDTITAGAGATGEYWIFGGAGSDTITVGGTGDTLIFGDDDYGLRDEFAAAFAAGGFNKAAAEAIMARAAGDLGMTLEQLKSNYTLDTQAIAGSDGDTITVGSGDHTIFTGAGADSISTGGASGEVRIYAGAGDDTITANGDDVLVEGGAGSDRIFLGDGVNRAYGWGAAMSADGLSTDQALNAAAAEDGADLIIGGAGTDTIWGHFGDDVIEGGDGADEIRGNLGNDLISGGRLSVSHNGVAIDVASSDLHLSFPGVVVVDAVDLSDGNDVISGDGGNDILLGGGESDAISGGGGSDIMVGDFSELTLSGNRVLQGVAASGVTSTNQGADSITGGAGQDILIGGGGGTGQVDELTDTEGTNTLIGDHANVIGSRPLEAVLQVVSVASQFGNDDIITSGGGHDVVLGGEGSDTIDAGTGTNIVSGDLASIDLVGGTATAIATFSGGADTILTGTASASGDLLTDRADLVIGGAENDTISVGQGRNAILGDDGTITFDAAARRTQINFLPAQDASPEEAARVAADLAAIDAMIIRLDAQITDEDGNDTVTALDGADFAILGGGDDTADLGEGINRAIGDNGSIRQDIFLLSARTDTRGGDDTITTGDDGDLIIGGSGDDTLDLANGDNVVLGDVGDLYMTADTGTLITVFSSLGGADGADTVTTGGGRDSVILGGNDDVADLGQGINVVLGDTGQIYATTGSVRTDSAIDAGDDTITTGDEIDIVIAGAASDTVIAGEGDNLILGDTGVIRYDATTFAAVDLFSLNNSEDGDDTVTTGAGEDVVVLGGKADTADLGDGFNRVLGDSGTISLVSGYLESASNTDARGDSITTGSGTDMIVGGSANDTISAGAGENSILGDTGRIGYIVAAGLVNSMTATSDVLDGSDQITAGDDTNRVIGGGKGDTITLGDGFNAVLGDSGTITPFTGVLISAVDEFGGNDTISSGASADAIIGGSRSDVIDAGAGDNSILGDTGEIRHNVLTFVGFTMQSVGATGDGDDVVTTLGGNDLVILGGRADTANLGEGNNRVLGDSGTIETRSAFMTGLADGFAGRDTITTGTGRDIVIAGGQADTVNASAGDNAILGDTGTITHDRTTLATSTMQSVSDSGDRGDTVTTLGGKDDVILGGGNDIANLGNGLNRVLGGSGTLNLVTGVAETRADADATTANSDTITTGIGNDVVIAGYGNDVLTLGDGNNVILGDTGRVSFLVTDNTALSLSSTGDNADGFDRLTTGTGRDYAILGGDRDEANVGAGDNIVLGDSGTLDLTLLTATTTSSSTAGDDTITALGGVDLVIGGSFTDTISVGSGDNIVLGDAGTVTWTGGTPVLRSMSSTGDVRDGSDIVTTTNGNDHVILGGNDDTANLGEGVNRVLADSGTIDATLGSMTGVVDFFSGDDQVTTGGGADLVILGTGADTLSGGAGDNLVLGDSGNITHQVGGTDLRFMSSETNTFDGRDTVTLLEGADRVILGGDDDLVAMGGGANWVLGDSGRIDRETGEMSSAASSEDGDDRIVVALSGGVASGSNTGADLVIAGTGADEMDLSAGDNAAIGDSGTIRFAIGAETLISLTSDSNALDGRDTMRALEGDDIAILGGAADRAELGAGNNRAIGDSGLIDVVAGRMEASSATYLDLTPAASTAGDAAADVLIAGIGADILIGGSLADTIQAGDGDNTILGDTGVVTHGAGNVVLTASSTANTRDGIDTVTSGTGSDVVILGGRGDILNAGAGDNVVLGDSGSVDMVARTATTASDSVAGADGITTGGGSDIILAGSLNDTISGGAGDNVVLGDTGTVTWDAGNVLRTATSAADVRDGIDSVTLGAGNDAVILGGAGDTLNAGAGTNRILGDSGTIDALTGTMTTASDSMAGADSIVTGDGSDLILAGSGADTVTGGAGHNIVLGDTGTVTHVVGATTLLRAESAADARDGVDEITLLGGADRVIAGGAGDIVAFGDGDNVVLGDSGHIDDQIGEIATTSDMQAGDDTLVIAVAGGISTGSDIVLGGSGSDLIRTGNGGDAVLGDTGTVLFDTATRALRTLNTTSDLRDGVDTVITGSGDDIVLLGGGADTLEAGAGSDRILGDSGTVDVTAMSLTATQASIFDGADLIEAGSGADIVIAGAGADTVDGDSGANVILGDHGTLTHDAAFALFVATGASDALDGNDLITTGDDADIVMLGGGSDTLSGGAGDNIVLGDSGTIDRLNGSLETASDTLGGMDEITLGSGSDMILGGSDADVIVAGAGDNLILGDTGTITHVVGTTAPRVLASATDTEDGADDIRTGGGSDAVILGGGDDVLVVEGGVNRLLGDGGRIDAETGTITADASDLDGADDITTGTGADLVAGGAGSDLLTLGAGANVVLGDSGTISHDVSSFAALVVTGVADARDGDDILSTGTGDDVVVMGGGADSASVSDGDNRLLGDSGSIDLVGGTLVSLSDATDGMDTLTGGSGVDMILGGGFADAITAGDGANLILGDSGSVSHDVTTLGAVLLSSGGTTRDGADTITGGIGSDAVIGGGAGDSITLSDGDNRVLGDSGSIDAVLGQLESASADTDGADDITTGTGADLVAGGAGTDLLTLGAGANVVLGDSGTISHDVSSFAALVVTGVADARDGDDILSTGTGDDVVVMGGGADSASVSDGDNRLLGDSGSIDLIGGTLVSLSDATDGMDTLTGGSGVDMILGGGFADAITAGDGANLILGDSGSVSHDVTTLGAVLLSSGGTTRDGADTITGGIGSDAVIGGGAGDSITLSDGDNRV